MAKAMSSKQERPESSPWFDDFLLCLTRLSQREVILARRLALKGYGMDRKPRKESPDSRK
jgi:hypothetical protein